MTSFNYTALESHIRAQGLEYLASHGFTAAEAQSMLAEADALGMDLPAQEDFYTRHFTGPDGSTDQARLNAFTRFHGIERTVATYRTILERRAEATQAQTARTDIEASVRALKDAGFSAGEAALFFNRHIKDARAITPHPTEGLSPEGVKLCLELVEAAEKESPQKALEEVIGKMFTAASFTAVKKATILEEIDQDTIYSKIHLEGSNRLNRLIEDALWHIYGAKLAVNTNTSPRSWAYDADGKPNADGFGMLAKMTTSTMESFRLIAAQLGKGLDKGDIPAPARGGIEKLLRRITTLEAELRPIYEQSRQVVEALALSAPEERGALYDDFYYGRAPDMKSFADLSADFFKLYNSVGSKNVGLDFYSTALKALDAARQSAPDNLPIDEVFRTVQSMGFVLEKGQTRHNDFVYKEIINRFIHKVVNENDPAAEWILATMTAPERDMLKVHPEKPWDKIVKPKRQSEIWEALITAMRDDQTGRARRRQIAALLYAANPLTYRADGYPEQEHTLLDRLRLRSSFQLEFEEGIISDSQDLAPFRQRFLAEVFAMPAMKHMPLFEDLLNFGISQTLMGRFARHGGSDSATRRVDILSKIGIGTGYDGLHVIVPASDSSKEGGPGARLKALRQYRKLARKALDTKIPIQIMLGGGLSLGRFGGDIGIVRRIVAQEMKRHALAHHHNFDWRNPADARILRMVSAVLYTEQGRANRFLSATPGQVCDTIAGRIAESVQDLLDLTGAVPDYTYIDKPAPLTATQDRLTSELADRTLAVFNRLRHARDDGGERVLDSFADKVRPAALMPYANNGARPASKSGSKGISEERAIGNDQSLYAAQLFHGGFYGLGTVMAGFKESGQAADLAAVLLNSPDVEYANIVSGLTDAMRFNAPALFAKVNTGSAPWNFDRAIKTGRNTDIIDGTLLCHEPGVSADEAYLAKIYYDRALFLAVLEGAATGALESRTIPELIAAIRPADGGLIAQPGPATRGRWPLPAGITAKHRRNAAGYAVMNGVNHAVLRGQEMQEGDLRALMGSWRSGTAPHDDLWAANARRGFSPFTRNRREHKANFYPEPKKGAPAPVLNAPEVYA